jgi:hypothetical protein
MPADPLMPRQMPLAVERALREKLGWRYRPSPIDLYMAIRDVLAEAEVAATKTPVARHEG